MRHSVIVMPTSMWHPVYANCVGWYLVAFWIPHPSMDIIVAGKFGLGGLDNETPFVGT